MDYLKTCIVLLCFITISFSKSVRQQDSAKAELEEYIANKKPEINHRYRPLYHVAGPVGWINDPNGFIHYKGEYHLFFQFYPYGSVWGPMHWGHVSSSDLVNWKELPTALLPEEEQCFSGSAVVDGDTMVLIYTGHLNTDTDPFYNETQYLAVSEDGVDFTKYKGNPVIPAAPNGSPDFRDPKAWRYGDYWYVIIGSKTADQRGRVLLYRSEDLITWEFLNVLGESDGSLGYMWECPDFFELNGKHVILMSPQGMEPVGDRYHNIHQTGYIIGNFNYDTFEFIPETQFQEIDFGHDFYAAQTTEHDGKRYLVAWFNSWEKAIPETDDGWSGIMTMVREIRLSDNRIYMTPVDATTSLRDETGIAGNLEPGEILTFDKAAEIIVEGDLNNGFVISIEGNEGGDLVWLSWNPETEKVALNRNGDIRQVEWRPEGSRAWRIFLDASSLEVFCGEGEVVFSSRVYPTGGWKVTNIGTQNLNVEAYSLKRSVPV